MENLILFVHLITAIAIIALILLQRGKGAEMGASFGGGASQTLFGAAGSGNFFSRMTSLAAIVFFATSFGLAFIAKEKSSIDLDIPVPAAEETIGDIPAGDVSDIPALPVEQSEEFNSEEIPALPSE